MRVLHLLAGGTRGGAETLIAGYMRDSKHQNTYCALFFDGPILDEISSEVRVIRLASANLLQKRKALRDLVRSGNFDVVVSHQWFGKPALLLESIDFREIPLVVVAHSCYEPGRGFRGSRLMKLPTRRLYEKADVVIAISQYVERNHRESFGSHFDSRVIYNGVDIKRYFSDKDLSRPISRPLTILYLGRLEAMKGVHILLRACAMLDDLEVSYCLRIVGWGSQSSALKQLSEELNVAAEFIGETAEPEKYCREADVFVHAAICQEGFGIALVEAMSTGCICVASRVGGIPEIIEDGVSGYLINAGDAAGMCDVLRRISQMGNEEALEMRKAAISRSSIFSLKKFIDSYDQLIDGLVRA